MRSMKKSEHRLFGNFKREKSQNLALWSLLLLENALQRFRFDGTKWGILWPGCFCGIASTDVWNIVLSSLSRGIPFPRMIISREFRSYWRRSICLLAGMEFPSYGNNIFVLGIVVLLIGGSILYLFWELTGRFWSFCYFLLLHRQV